MILKTKHFGEIEINENAIITFESGLPGFETLKEFILIDNGDQTSPFKWLQCVNEPQVAFAVANPFMILTGYDIDIPEEAVAELDLKDAGDVLVYAIVVVPQDITKISMNLKAPIIINGINKKGAQIILDTGKYSVRHYILEELRRQEESADAGANTQEKPVDCCK